MDRKGFKGQKFSLYSVEVEKKAVSLDRREHEGCEWVPFSQAVKMLKWPNQKKSLRIVNEELRKEK